MLAAALILVGALISGCVAAPYNDVVTTNVPPLFTMDGSTPVMSVKDITGLTNLPPGSDWFTAALIAAVNCKTQNSINKGTAIRQINYTAAAFSLHTPESPEQTEVVVDVRELPVLPPTGSPWWAAGYMEAMRKHGPFKYGLYSGASNVGAYNNGTWTFGLGMYGFQFLSLGAGYIYRSNDTAQIQKIAKVAETVPITVTTIKGLITTENRTFQGDTSVRLTEYALLGLKSDGAVLMKGRANMLDTDGMIPNTEDLAKNSVLFSSSADITQLIR